ncbi:MAG: nucleotidyltransferase domain-containing protein [Desulfobacterales bacterium]
MIDFAKYRKDIENICRKLPVKRLGVFGSALTPDFSQNSDIDVLAVFDSDRDTDLFSGYFDLKEQLEKIFRREVDLVVDKAFRNPVFRESVEKTRTVIYER